MSASRLVEILRSLGVALGALAVVAGLGACSASDAGSDDAAAEPNETTCSLAIRLAGGGLIFDSSGSDMKACASAQSGPGVELTFIPVDRRVVSAVKVSARRVEAGVVASALPAGVTVEHVDGRTSHPIACQITLLDNTRVKSDPRGDRYRLSGTGACASPDPLTGVGVDGTFEFASSALWTKP